MIRKDKSIELDGKVVVVKELTNRDILAFLEKHGELLEKNVAVIKLIPPLVKTCIGSCTNLQLEEFLDMPARYSIAIRAAFEELNKDFFSILQGQQQVAGTEGMIPKVVAQAS